MTQNFSYHCFCSARKAQQTQQTLRQFYINFSTSQKKINKIKSSQIQSHRKSHKFSLRFLPLTVNIHG